MKYTSKLRPALTRLAHLLRLLLKIVLIVLSLATYEVSQSPRSGTQSNLPPATTVQNYRKRNIKLIIALFLCGLAFGLYGWNTRPPNDAPPALNEPGVIYYTVSPAPSDLDVKAEIDAGTPSRETLTFTMSASVSYYYSIHIVPDVDYASPCGSAPFTVSLSVTGPVYIFTGVSSPSGNVLIRMCWYRYPPVNYDGAYLSAALPSLGGWSTPVTNKSHFHPAYTVQLDFNDLQYILQSGVSPNDPFDAGYWNWTPNDPTQPVVIADAVDPARESSESHMAFRSGIALGIAGAFLVTLMPELFGYPLYRRGKRKKGK